MDLSNAQIVASSVPKPRAVHLGELEAGCESDLERDWLLFLEERNLRLPTHAQFSIPTCQTRADFFYAEQQASIYVDGPPHDYPDRQQRDHAQETAMENLGYQAVRFHHRQNWEEIVTRFPGIFGRMSKPMGGK
jgi:very-short-patch-repair endonuclease